MLDAGSNRKSASTKSAGSRWKMRSMRVRSPGAYSQSSMHSVHTVEEEGLHYKNEHDFFTATVAFKHAWLALFCVAPEF